MTTSLIGGPVQIKGSRTAEGHRRYDVLHLVTSDCTNYATHDGPFNVLETPGLPQPGDIWAFGADLDIFAFCLGTARVTPQRGYRPGELIKTWRVSQQFSTIPAEKERCQDQSITDPLLEPPKLSGSFVKYLEEAQTNKDGNPIRTSSHERVKGAIVEFDANRPTVHIEQNVPDLELDLFSQMIDTLNDSLLWNMPSRRVKLSNVSWQRKLYGTCGFYFTRALDFDVRYDGFDRVALDEGTKVLNGHWESSGWTLDDIGGSPPDPENPGHFIRYKDRRGENSKIILDGQGKPWEGTGESGFGTINIQKYSESNFLLLNIPAVLA